MVNRGWHRAVLRVRLLALPAGIPVAVARTRLTHTSIGQTFWVMSIDRETLYHVSESFGGKDLRALVRIERPVKDPELCTTAFHTLIRGSQYHGKRRLQVQDILPLPNAKKARGFSGNGP